MMSILEVFLITQKRYQNSIDDPSTIYQNACDCGICKTLRSVCQSQSPDYDRAYKLEVQVLELLYRYKPLNSLTMYWFPIVKRECTYADAVKECLQPRLDIINQIIKDHLYEYY